MGILVGYPNIGGTEKDLQLNFGLPISEQVEMRTPHLPAEWFPQSGVQLTWPHAGTDWAYMLEEVQQCFVQIAREIASREKLLIVTPEPDEVLKQIENQVNMDHVVFLQAETNDTWARDHGAITMLDGNAATLLDFKFNGWGPLSGGHAGAGHGPQAGLGAGAPRAFSGEPEHRPARAAAARARLWCADGRPSAGRPPRATPAACRPGAAACAAQKGAAVCGGGRLPPRPGFGGC